MNREASLSGMGKYSGIFVIAAVILAAFTSRADAGGGDVTLSGHVVDTDTGEPLAFVNIVYNERGTGTTTGIDGWFTITSALMPDFLKLSYVGYEKKTVIPSGDDAGRMMLIGMKQNPVLLEEVTIRPGINPAHRIIRKAFENRRINNPEMLSAFSYTSYNKLYFTLVPDSFLSVVNLPGSANVSIRFAFTGSQVAVQPVSTDDAETAQVDSSEIRLREFIEKQHLFLMESVSKREYRRPGRNSEQVVASRVSGFSDPSFSLLATQMQSFTFYEDFISILDRRYLNPISRGSTSRYSFILEDSMFTEQDDTLFIISFRPYPGRNFDGLQGVLYINSNGYAVQNVITEPFEPQGFFTIRIRQNYNFVDKRQWFPGELNTDIIFGRETASAGNETRHNLVGIGKSYLSDIEIEQETGRRRFSNIELEISPDAYRKDYDYWNRYRVEPLTAKDLQTYHYIDSLGKEANFDRTLRIFETLASGYIPWGFLNVDYASLIDYNYFEGLRPGFSAVTNDRVSRRFSVGGHLAWGFKDKEAKYGVETNLLLHRAGDMNLRLSYSRDVKEAGGYDFFGPYQMLSTESYRRFMVGRMDYSGKYDASLTISLPWHLSSRIYIERKEVTPGDGYMFTLDGNERNSFLFTEAGLQLRFAYRERFMKTPRGTKLSMGTDYPVLWFNIGRGTDLFGGGYEYTRISAAMSHTISTIRLGRTSVMLEGGITDSHLPFHVLFSGKGSFRDFSVEAANSFATMRPAEFISDRFASLFLRQNFESLLFRSGSFRPEVVLVTNLGIGQPSGRENHLNIQVNTMEKGYIESGILVNNLLRQLFMGYGIGVFYRYGPYSFDRVTDNFAFKLTLNINLRLIRQVWDTDRGL